MADHGFCKALLRTVRGDLTSEQRKRLVGAWSYMYERQGEFQVPNEGFYWHGSAHCSYDARQQGISAWVHQNYPENDPDVGVSVGDFARDAKDPHDIYS